MIEQRLEELVLLSFERLAQESGFVHAVTGGRPNFAPHRGQGRNEAIQWRQRVCQRMGMPFERLTSPAQIHGNLILKVEKEDEGQGRFGRDTAIPYVDGLVCDAPGVPLILLSADCPLVVVCDPDRPAVGAVHASWLGTVSRITSALVEQMVTNFDSDPARLLAGIAPSAGPCCYEVGEEVYRIAQTRLEKPDDCFRSEGGKLYLDLWRANQQQLMAGGVPDENIEVAEICSICDERLWSHRRDGSEAGRFALFCGLK
jgi:hypothetical protein